MIVSIVKREVGREPHRFLTRGPAVMLKSVIFFVCGVAFVGHSGLKWGVAEGAVVC